MTTHLQSTIKLTSSIYFRIGILLMFMLAFNTNIFAQKVIVKGTITDATSGEPLIGTSVVVKGQKSGTVSDVNGKFQLTVSDPNAVIVCTYIGYIKMETPLNGKTELTFQLSQVPNSMEEVVVIGYGSKKKRDLTGSVTSVQGSVLAMAPVTSVGEALTGRLTGVQITTADGSPDAELLVRVRGGGSITGDNTPLYIVDGFPVGSLNAISPQDIQSIDVLKDASSTAIYGSRGANGVVIITTKSVKGGKTQVSYNAFMQTKQLSKRLAVLDPYQYVRLNYELAALNGTTGIAGFNSQFGVYGDMDLYKYQTGHDWQNDMFGSNVVSNQHNLTITGGNDKTKFSLSTTYNKDGGLMVGNNYNRFNTYFKISHELSKNLTVNFNTRISNTVVNGSGSSGGTYKIRTSQAVTSPAVNGLSDFTTVDLSTMTDDEQNQWAQAHMSLAAQAAKYWKQTLTRTFNFTGSLDWKILPNLTYRIEGGYEFGFNESKNYWGANTTTASYVDGNPLVDWTKVNTTAMRVANTLTYRPKLGSAHNINILAGQESNSALSNQNYIYATGFGIDLTPEKIFANLALGGATKNVSSRIADPSNLLSYFGRIDYTYKDKYLLSGTFRADGSSKFAPGNQWAYFPSVAAAWRINQESLFQNTKEWLSNLKLRASYGEAGNNRISSGMFQKSYSIQSTKTYGLGDLQNNYWAVANTQLPNRNLKWETTITENIGLDFGFFNERISGTLEAYKNKTKDLLIEIPIVAPGYSTTMMNVGQTSNKGIELTLNASIIQKKDFTFGFNFNIAFNKTNVDKLADGLLVQEYASGWAGTDSKGVNDYRVTVGQPVGLMYGWVSDGYYKTTDFASYDASTGKYTLKDGVPTIGMLGGKIGVRPGTAKYKDSNNDGVINDLDRAIIGHAGPKFLGGFGFNGTFHGFDATLLFNYVYGNNIYNANRIASSQQYRTTNPNMLAYMNESNRYSYLNANGQIVTDLATLAQMNEGANAKQYWSPWSFGNAVVVPASWAIEDGSYLRLQNVTLGYSLPKNVIRKIKMEQFRIFCTLNNVWILTNYSGYDPEVSTPIRGSSTSGLTQGVDYSAYPKSFSWTFGINVTF